MKVNDLLIIMRQYRQVSRAKMAKKLGLSRARIYAIESSENLEWSTVQSYATALDFEIMAFPKKSITKENLTNT